MMVYVFFILDDFWLVVVTHQYTVRRSDDSTQLNSTCPFSVAFILVGVSEHTFSDSEYLVNEYILSTPYSGLTPSML
jgi:hypothetical protein